MFIKIKLEPQSLKALSPLKKISYFSIDDDAIIINLKMKIEEYVDVPAERQEIRTLTKVFENNWHVKEVCDVRGSAIMLYAYDEEYEYEEPQFVCFLQIYTNELAAQQQELEERLKLSEAKDKLTTPHSSTSSITLIADTDKEESSDSDSASSESSDSESDSVTDNSDSSCGKKRSKPDRKNAIQNKKLKVTAPTGEQYSETLCKYLDEFPKCSNSSNAINNEGTPPNKVLKNSFIENSKKEIPANDPDFPAKPSENKEILKTSKAILSERQVDKESSSNVILKKIQSNIITTTNNKGKNNNIHPCYTIKPEIRDYLAIISLSDKNTSISNSDCEELLVWFFDRFRACDLSSQLQFDNKNAISLFEGKLWIACMNINTFQWISKAITQYTQKTFKILDLRDGKHVCELVVPVVAQSKNILDIFELLEKQNKNISTLKWSLQSRRELSVEDKEFNEKAISTFCTNELFNIVIDTESREYLEKSDFKLKYCFWQIVAKFI